MMRAVGEGIGKEKSLFFREKSIEVRLLQSARAKKTPRTGEPGVAVFELFRVGAPVTYRQCDAAGGDFASAACRGDAIQPASY
ncbi:hypothetical protein FHY34_000124 [Xanthomonas arboricola]|uniref:hypothetical protein n=1 Tax=Xanthomonas arboricola TaxID=56448 RepID=UPI0011B0E24C|nr:hypothetical protein [Xanthomonas arboricola]MBB4706303.1 hypothetical protein [Xanthomonas arboricola]